MPAVPTVVGTGRYTITPFGRAGLHSPEVCDCHIKLVGLLVECPECGTVYGYTRESAMAAYQAERKHG